MPDKANRIKHSTVHQQILFCSLYYFCSCNLTNFLQGFKYLSGLYLNIFTKSFSNCIESEHIPLTILFEFVLN